MTLSKHYGVLFLMSLLVIGLNGCSSTGYSTRANLVLPKTIRSPANIPPALIPHAARFVAILEQNGFAVGRTQDPRALDLTFELTGVFTISASTSLWREGIPVLSASASNSGVGTGIARGPAINALADSVVSTFESELKSLMSHAQIVPDAQP